MGDKKDGWMDGGESPPPLSAVAASLALAQLAGWLAVRMITQGGILLPPLFNAHPWVITVSASHPARQERMHSSTKRQGRK